MGMSIFGENTTPDIADILTTIQQMAAEKKARLKGQELSKKSIQSDKPPHNATSQRNIASYQSINDLEDDDEIFSQTASSLKSTQNPQAHTVRENTPRVAHKNEAQRSMPSMPSMMDRHFDRLTEYTAKAWPGYNGKKNEQSNQTVQVEQSAFCFGPILSSQTTPNSGTSLPQKAKKQPAFIPSCFQGLPDIEKAQSKTAQPPTSHVSVHANKQESFDEVSAQLLRPLIMQWVNDNLPRLVEGALSRENKLA